MTSTAATRTRTPSGITLHPLDLTREHGERDFDLLCYEFDLWAAARGFVTTGQAATANPYLCCDDMHVAVTRRHLLEHLPAQVSERIVETRGTSTAMRFVQNPGDTDYDRWWKELARTSDIRIGRDELWATFDDTFPQLPRGEMSAYQAIREIGRGRILARSRTQIHAIIGEVIDLAGASDEELQIAAELLPNHAGPFRPEHDDSGWDVESLHTLTWFLSETVETARYLLEH